MISEMTSRERVETALNHEEPDRVPLDIGGCNCTTLSVEAYEKLKKHMGVSYPTRILSEIWRLPYLDEEVMIHLGSDVRPININPPRKWTPPSSEPGTCIDEWGCKWRKSSYDGGYYWELAEFPLANATMADIETYSWPDPEDPGRFEGLDEKIERLKDTPYALLGDPGFKMFWERFYMLRGFEQALVDLVSNEELVHALMEKIFEINVAVTKRFLEVTGPYLTVVRTADDLATQESLLISPETYRKMIKPYHKKFNAFIKQYTDAKIFYHCCGNITPLLDDLIQAGVEILNPIQVSMMGNPAELKSKYGDMLTFWGGIDIQKVMSCGSPEEVRDEVSKRIRQFGPGGGYVVAAAHNIQVDVPACNVLAMSRAAREFGIYPVG